MQSPKKTSTIGSARKLILCGKAVTFWASSHRIEWERAISGHALNSQWPCPLRVSRSNRRAGSGTGSDMSLRHTVVYVSSTGTYHLRSCRSYRDNFERTTVGGLRLGTRPCQTCHPPAWKQIGGGPAKSARPRVNRHGQDQIRVEEETSCFVASAAFQDEQHPVGNLLRRFRDNVLLQSAPTRRLVGVYYLRGPQIAEIVKRRPILRFFFVVVLSLVAATFLVFEWLFQLVTLRWRSRR